MTAAVAATGNGRILALIDARGRVVGLNGDEIEPLDLISGNRRLAGRGWKHAMRYVRGTNVLCVLSWNAGGEQVERRFTAVGDEIRVASHLDLRWSRDVAGITRPAVTDRWPVEFDPPPLGGATRAIVTERLGDFSDEVPIQEAYARSVLVIALHHQTSGGFIARPGTDVLLAQALDVCGERGAAEDFFEWALTHREIDGRLLWGFERHLRHAQGTVLRERYEGLREGPGPELAAIPPLPPRSRVGASLWSAWRSAVEGRPGRTMASLRSALGRMSRLDLFVNPRGIDLETHALLLIAIHALIPPRRGSEDFFFEDQSLVQDIRRSRALYGGAFHSGLPTDGDRPALEVEIGDFVQATGVTAELARGETAAISKQADGLWTAPLPAAAPGEVVRYKVAVRQAGDDESTVWASDSDPRPGGQEFAYEADPAPPPDWTRDAVVYQIMVDRFARPGAALPAPASSTALYGGTLDGVTENLDYIAALGCNVIWLTPVHKAPSHHGYNHEDFYKVEERYGGEAALKRLIDSAHSRGMRVLLDFVPNHTGRGHHLFKAAVENGGEDAEFFRFWQWPHYYRCFFDVISLPELDTGRRRVQDYLVKAARHWVTAYGADGVRCDHVAGVDPAFWIELRRGLRAVRPDALILGEATGKFEWLARYAGRIDAIFDFDFCYVVRQALAKGRLDAATFARWLDEHEQAYPGLALATLFDNHDMNRFLWMAGGSVDRLKLASTLLMTLPGMPVIYYGTEVGLSQRHDGVGENAEARLPMLWGADQNTDLLQHFQRLGGLRRESDALRRGTRRTLLADSEVLAYERAFEDQRVVVALNFSERPQRRELDGFGSLDLEPLGSTIL